MRFLKGVVLYLLVAASPLYAQLTEIQVDGSSIPGSDIAGITINQSGQVVVTSVAGVEYEIVEKEGDPNTTTTVSINSFTLNGLITADLDVGSSATVQWGTSNAVSCAASVSSAVSLDDWNSTTVIGIAGPATVAFPEAGVYTLQLDCSGSDGSLASAVATARVGSVSVTSFTVSPTSAEKGADVSVTLTWSSQNATLGCAGSANWPNSDALPDFGTRTFNVSNIDQATEYQLTCFGGFDEDARVVSINVTEPVATCDVTLTSRTVKTWDSIFNADWPAPSSGQMRISIPDYGYFAIGFQTGNVVDAGLLGNIEASGTVGGRLGALSEIPGCFDVADECQFFWGRSGGIIWDTQGTADRCQLKPNTIYYWNMTFTDGSDPASSSCIGSACDTYLRVVNPD